MNLWNPENIVIQYDPEAIEAALAEVLKPGMPPECRLPPVTAEEGVKAFGVLKDMLGG